MLRSFYFGLFVILSSLSAAQTTGDNKANATLLGVLRNWCSANAEYATQEITFPQPKGTCNESDLYYGKWFRFLATTSSIEITVKIGAEEGTMQFPYIYLWDENLNELACKQYDDADDDLVLNFHELKRGKWHYFTIYNHSNSKYVGMFTLCVNDEVTYDFKEGAIELFELNRWCSPEEAYTTEGATPDEKQGSCLPKGPNFNRWFTFSATTNSIKATVKYGDSKGTAKFPYITLWDENLIELTCGKYKDESEPIRVESSNLIKGKTYYLSVDHKYNENYTGSFTLCIDDGSLQKQDLVIILGRMMDKAGDVAGSEIKLLNEYDEVIQTVSTDNKGKFKFSELPPANYFILIDRDDSNLAIDIFQTDAEDKIIKKAVKREEKTFAFRNLPTNCGFVTLVDCDNFQISITEGKQGIIGKVVNKKDLTEGIQNMNIYLYDSPEKVVDSTVTDQFGKFKFLNFSPSQLTMVKFGKPDKSLYTEMLLVNDRGIALKAATSGQMDEKGFFRFMELPAIKAQPLALFDAEEMQFETGSAFTLNNIYFESGKYELLEKSFAELDVLFIILLSQPSLKIEIGGHTDNTGNENENYTLSENRAKAVVDYLVSKGIVKERLTHKGYGPVRPVVPNDTEEERKKNRRVEFRVIGK